MTVSFIWDFGIVITSNVIKFISGSNGVEVECDRVV